METPDNVTGIFANVSGEMYFYSRGIKVVVVQMMADKANDIQTVIEFPKEKDSYSYDVSSWSNNTAMYVVVMLSI